MTDPNTPGNTGNPNESAPDATTPPSDPTTQALGGSAAPSAPPAYDPAQGGYAAPSAPPAGYPQQPSAPQPPSAPYSPAPTGEASAAPNYAQPPYPSQPYGQAPDPSAGYPAQPYAQPGYGEAQPPVYGETLSPAYGETAPTGYGEAQPGYGAPQAAYGDPAQGYPAGAYAAPGGYPATGGYAAPGYPAAPGYAPDGSYQYGQPAAPVKKSRKGLWITILVVVIVVLGGGGAALYAIGKKNSASADGAVKDYLTALSKNDAKGALAVVQNQPPSATFLTNDILTKQQAIAKISNIKVDKVSNSSGKQADVHATYTFGTQNVDQEFTVSKLGDKWKLATGTVPVDVTDIDDIPGLTLFGTAVKGLGKVYVFPGPLTWGSNNANYTVTNKDAAKYATSPEDTNDSFFTLDDELSAAGQKKVSAAVGTYLQGCAASKALEPDNCPQSQYDYEGVDGTATWTLVGDPLSTLKYQLDDSKPNSVEVTGDTDWTIAYQAKDFNGNVTNANDKDSESIYGTVDISAATPTFAPD